MIRFAVALFTALLLAACSQQPAATDTGNATPNVQGELVPAQQASGELRVSPAKVKAGQKVTLRFFLKDRSGKPMSDASVKATIAMATGDSEMEDQTDLEWDGAAYVGTIAPGRAGTWDVTVEAKAGDKLLLSLPSQIDVR